MVLVTLEEQFQEIHLGQERLRRQMAGQTACRGFRSSALRWQRLS